ncbi:histidinol dehydrogenase [Ardenticatena maritima]|uniref:Histidinol dehydrogenase n=1 Tax=Ardenticatena maritima TaxID=872965 RepID=A0A0M8KBN1_9CHLR|nr:histidinol dehydrogenase [Ardenticatena maritima]GAP64439.1 histidinol dehydrogenase [Ardenticatena maritima]
MIRILTVEEARQTILKRELLGEGEIPPERLERLREATKRPHIRSAAEGVAAIIEDVRTHGDEAVRYYNQVLDGAEVGDLEVPPERMAEAFQRLPSHIQQALTHSAERVRRFHEEQARRETGWQHANAADGTTLGQLVRPLERVGIYAPGGQALYPSSVIMAAVPAVVAGVREIVLVSPPSGPDGIADLILGAAHVSGVTRAFNVGGAQAIAALAYGTESIPRVDKILGPGGLFVVLAMKQVFGVTGIAGLPGPTETLLIADDSANPALVAADLLAQAEHDVLASALLLTPSRRLAEAVAEEVARQVAVLPRRPIIEGSLQRGSGIVLTRDIAEAVALANDYAPEHLCLLLEDPWAWVPHIQHAGGVFVGETACEALGDYIVGPSHIMPTSRTARFSSPVNVRDFQKIISLFGVNEDALQRLGPDAIALAEAEGLQAHAEAIRKRLRG